MKNHQYAIADYNLKIVKKELRDLHFLDDSTDDIDNPAELLKTFLLKSFLDQQSLAIRGQKIAGMLASFEENALTFLDKNAPISKIGFYNIALQLLHFEVGEDFLIDNPITKMKTLNLPVANVHDNMNLYDTMTAWYLLLNTHNKYGTTFIDELASKGYFAQNLNGFKKPLIFNGKTMPVYDTNNLIREVVYVESSQDNDHDGKLNLLKTEIIRPKESNKNKVPVIFTASPYNQGTNDKDGEQLTHNVNVSLKHKEPNNYSYSDIEHHSKKETLPEPRPIEGKTRKAEQTLDREQSYTLNDYFLARGFAVVYSAGIGTYESDGFRTTGDDDETLSATAIIEWLNGKRTAFTNKTDNNQIEAYWSNGSIAMSGRSYLGTLQIAAATTGIDGLKTCIAEAAISNWYDYYRENGLVLAPGGFQGEDADVLAAETYSRKQQATEFYKNKDAWEKQLSSITDGQDRDTGNYNEFWDARNYLKNAKNIKADMFLIHGLNDDNVKPKNVEQIWNAIKTLNINKKLILHQGKHIYINAFQSIDFTDMINLWLTYKLLDVDNKADELIPNVLIQDNVKAETWNAFDEWENPDDVKTLHPSNNNELTDEFDHGRKEFKDQLSVSDFEKYCLDYKQWRDDLVLDHENNPLTNNRVIFKTTPTKEDFTIDGKVKISLNASSTQNYGMLSCMLVDYGEAYRLTESPKNLGHRINEGYLWREDSLREFKIQNKKTPYKEIAEGHINMQNRKNSYHVDDMEANEFYDMELELQPTFYHVLAGHQLGLIIFATDFENTIRGNQDLKYRISLAETDIKLPIRKQ
ncbi:Xaa-Pro dipeptidyl-peptidase [Apilactobacillus micheneri]|uniref:Xaa-Pro dipeptidyl-peptidase n=1 Tax=Apilactobacillus micheneri TaxID=1899430 RepID=UPI00112DEBB8|nr:Xaa-Pro dipeptidyl-peptidase [Apilactobacillus micheneri]TPR42539.1 Xaa-Pro dipeptidyl-peptidase [Apilactobacillus micheneri]TPR45508.1 Xaa-Pro dipeptidyl-peptidase [Apilactobacillus micheneri]TPR48954.1 Xaa-Pro dipeptidyl-peptidase [Apilactobacillus micheneri]TPR50011.1 Xaa-Pro dipeptidyl-peptidase [Apilactobacillus micheneri]TPR52344.1 Xaa-Pro dipeptidyl-peptidase [Apilactobacillus micheneri]